MKKIGPIFGRKKKGGGYVKKPEYQQECPPCVSFREIHNRDGTVVRQCNSCGATQEVERK